MFCVALLNLGDMYESGFPNLETDYFSLTIVQRFEHFLERRYTKTKYYYYYIKTKGCTEHRACSALLHVQQYSI